MQGIFSELFLRARVETPPRGFSILSRGRRTPRSPSLLSDAAWPDTQGEKILQGLREWDHCAILVARFVFMR